MGYLKEKRRVESSFPDETVCSAEFCCLRLPRRSLKSFQGNHSLNLAILILYDEKFLILSPFHKHDKMQLLAKIKKILRMGFRATINFRKCRF